MKFENRKLYAHAQNSGVFLLQIPKLIVQDMQLSKETEVNIEYSDGMMIITKKEDNNE